MRNNNARTRAAKKIYRNLFVGQGFNQITSHHRFIHFNQCKYFNFVQIHLVSKGNHTGFSFSRFCDLLVSNR